MKIHREGYATLLIAGLLVGGIAILLKTLHAPDWLMYIAGALLTVLFLIVLQFFRDPVRYTPYNDNHLISPADGKVVVIEETTEPEYFGGEKKLQVSIFMSPFNVHVNRVPYSGVVKYSKYHKGKYLVAWHPKSSTENERTSVVIQAKNGKEVLFRQIAGALARRIVCYMKEGQQVKQGTEFGFIKFGSRMDIFLPPGTPLKVKIGDMVKGGETLIADIS